MMALGICQEGGCSLELVRGADDLLDDVPGLMLILRMRSALARREHASTV